MRYYKAIIEENLTYKQAIKKAKKMDKMITRPSVWDGVHVVTEEDYKILQRTGEILVNPDEIWNTERKYKDWAVVEPTNRAIEIIKK